MAPIAVASNSDPLPEVTKKVVNGDVIKIDKVDDKGAGPTPTSEEPPTVPNPVPASTTNTGTQLNGLKSKPNPDAGSDLPEPSSINRVSDLDTIMDLSTHRVHITDTKPTPPVWITGLTNSISSINASSAGAIEAISYAASDAIFVYESETNAGFGAWAEEQYAIATSKGWFQGRPQVLSMQTRAGAGTAIAGYLNAAGSGSASPTSSSAGPKRVTALTNVSSLLTMAPSLLAASSATGKLIVHASSAVQSTSDLSITNDYAAPLAAASLLGTDDTFTLILSSGRQEGVDVAAVLHSTAFQGRVAHVFDGAFAGRELGKLNVPTKVSEQASAATALEALKKANITPFVYSGPATPSAVIVVPNGAHAAAAAAVLAATAKGGPVGLLAVRIVRPWSDDALRFSIPASTKMVYVLDEVRATGAGGVLHEDVFSTLLGSSNAPQVRSLTLRAGTQLSASQWAAAFDSAAAGSPVSYAALQKASAAAPLLKTLGAENVVSIFDSDSSATSHLPTLLSRTLVERGDGQVSARILSRFDNYEAGGAVRSDAILSSGAAALSDVETPLSLLSSAQTLVIADPASSLKSYDIFSSLQQGGTVLINSPGWTTDELTAKLRAEDKRTLASKNAKLVLVDATQVVADLNVAVAKSRGAKATATPLASETATAVLLVALLRTHLKLPAEHIQELLQRVIGVAPLGPHGVPGLVAATESATKAFPYDAATWSSAEPASEAETISAERQTDLRFTAFGPSLDGSLASLEAAPVRTTRALPAWQSMFSEAYGLNADSLRPDLPEQNWVVTVTENRRLTPVDYDRNVFHLELSTKGTDLKYEIGEALGVHGWNDADEVREFIEWAGYDSEEIVSIPSLVDPSRYESRTVFQVLQQRLDVFGKPPKRFYEALSALATNVDEARWLRFVSSAEGSATFKKYSEGETLNYAEVLRMFPSARLPIDRLLAEIEPIKPRHYSIASAQAVVGESVHLLIVTVDWKTPSGSPRFGQCTRYLAGLNVGDQVTVSLKPSVMKLPPLSTQPIIMAGLGTGAAPFRAFIQARALQKAQGMDVGPLVYYFGSRYRSAEYLYGEELEAYTSDGVISKMGLAFSRDSASKTYIQHKIREDGDLLASYLAPELDALRQAGGQGAVVVADETTSGLLSDRDVEEGKKGFFYLCGPTWPVPDIFEELVGAFQKRGLDRKQAEDRIEELKEQERYVLEVY